jgi:hypothetical protein
MVRTDDMKVRRGKRKYDVEFRLPNGGEITLVPAFGNTRNSALRDARGQIEQIYGKNIVDASRVTAKQEVGKVTFADGEEIGVTVVPA